MLSPTTNPVYRTRAEIAYLNQEYKEYLDNLAQQEAAKREESAPDSDDEEFSPGSNLTIGDFKAILGSEKAKHSRVQYYNYFADGDVHLGRKYLAKSLEEVWYSPGDGFYSIRDM